MKTGNVISLTLVLFLFAGALLCDFVLASVYRKINLADPYKNFSKVAAGTFKTISISGGNGFAVQIRASEKPDIKLLNSRKNFFGIRNSGDTAYISFRVANQTYQSPENCITGLIISVPDLPVCILNGVNTQISGFNTDTMMLITVKKARVRLHDIHTKNLHINAREWSSVDFQRNNEAESLVLKLRGKASVTLNEVRFDKLEKSITDSANLLLYEPAIKAIWKIIDPVDRVKPDEK